MSYFSFGGALEYLDESGEKISIEDWRSILQKYVDYCENNNIPVVVDITYPKSKVPDVHFDHEHTHEL